MTSMPAAVATASSRRLPEAHLDAEAMADLAFEAATITGFEAVGVPFCCTVEAEAFGAQIDLGDAVTEARVVHEPYATVEAVRLPEVADLLDRGWAPVVVEAVRRLRERAGDLPIIINLIGPVSIGASVVEPAVFLRELRTRPEPTRIFLERITNFLVAWAELAIAAGADVVAVHEDSATPAIVGPKTFETVVSPHLARIAAAVRAKGAKSLLHLCGTLGRSIETIACLGFDGFVPDAAVYPAEFRAAAPGLAVVGNVSTFLLHQGRPKAIRRISRRLLDAGVDVLSPTCGLSSLTPLDNIRALTGAVDDHTPLGPEEDEDE